MQPSSNNSKTKTAAKALDIDDVDVVTEELTGCILQRRYLVGRALDAGSFGRVFKVVDLQDKELPLVMKVCEDHRMFAKEISAMHNIYKKAKNFTGFTQGKTPEVICYGMVMICDEADLADTERTFDEEELSDKKMMSYLIMPRFGRNLETYFESQKRVLHKSSIYHLGLACLDLLEQIHQAGYIYNDLKLDNLMVDYKQHLPSKSSTNKNAFANATINIVDFGFATKYVERNRTSN